MEFSAKLQPKAGSTRDINIPYIFTFQNRDGTIRCLLGIAMLLTSSDVQLLQECLTGRMIESQYVETPLLSHFHSLMASSATLNSFSLVVKKHHGFEIRGFEIGFWDSKREEIQAADFGAMQVWKVLEKDKLVGGFLLIASKHSY